MTDIVTIRDIVTISDIADTISNIKEQHVPKIITRKFMVLKKEPTHTRITELQLLLRDFIGNSEFDIYIKGSRLENICDLIDNVIQNKNKFKLKETTKDDKIEKKSLESILKEKLSVKLYKKIELNLLKLEEDESIKENEEGFDSEDDISVVSIDSKSVVSEGGYSLYHENNSDEEEAEFSD
jgi:hypothetical protein